MDHRGSYLAKNMQGSRIHANKKQGWGNDGVKTIQTEVSCAELASMASDKSRPSQSELAWQTMALTKVFRWRILSCASKREFHLKITWIAKSRPTHLVEIVGQMSGGNEHQQWDLRQGVACPREANLRGQAESCVWVCCWESKKLLLLCCRPFCQVVHMLKMIVVGRLYASPGPH